MMYIIWIFLMLKWPPLIILGVFGLLSNSGNNAATGILQFCLMLFALCALAIIFSGAVPPAHY